MHPGVRAIDDIDVAALFAMAAKFRQNWALRSPEGAFTYPIRFKGDGIWYFRPIVGAYITWSFFAHFAALAVLGLILFWNRHLLKRVTREEDGE